VAEPVEASGRESANPDGIGPLSFEERGSRGEGRAKGNTIVIDKLLNIFTGSLNVFSIFLCAYFRIQSISLRILFLRLFFHLIFII
jgi:hypothetical protein